MRNKLPITAAAALISAIVVLAPSDGFAWSENYFWRGDGHGQYMARRDTIALGAGDAMNHNRAIHTIDPWPAYARDDRLEFDGQRMDLAIDRYQANDSIPPIGMETQDISTEQSTRGTTGGGGGGTGGGAN